MKHKAIVYCRVSSEKQVREGHGMDGQELRCRQYADSKGYEVTAVFRDEGVSGGVSDRPGVKKLLAFLDAHAAFEKDGMIVLIDDISRIARDVSVHFELKAAITSRNARLESPTHTFEESPMGKLFETIMSGSAEFYRNENRMRVLKNMKSRLEKGLWPFDIPPGYKNVKEIGNGKVLRRDEPKASIIQEALEGYASRRFETRTEVKEFLEKKRFTHRAVFKGVVHLEQVSRLIERAPLYAGFIEYAPWDVSRRSGHHDALITADTFEKIEARERETEKRPFRKDLNADFPLRGFLGCSHCNKLMTASWSTGRKKQYAFYRCTSKGCIFQNKSVRRECVNQSLESLLDEMTPAPAALSLMESVLRDLWSKRMELRKEYEKTRQKEIREIEKEIDVLCDRLTFIRGETLIRKLESRVDQLETKKRSLQAMSRDSNDPEGDFGTALEEVCGFLQKPTKLWKSGKLEDQRMLLNLAFIGVMPYDKVLGFGTVRFSLPFELCRVAEHDKKQMVEMPGVEPGSNV